MTPSPPPDGPSRDLRERCAHAYYRLRWARDDWQHMAPVHREAYYEVADAILTEITRSGHVIVRERAIGDALSDAIMEATNHGWNDPDSAIWRRGMAAACVVWCAVVVGSETEREMERWEWVQ